MIVIDANILLHAYNSESIDHASAKQWLEKAFADKEPIRLAWVTALAFLRISTNSRIFSRPLTGTEATDIVTEWQKQPGFGWLEPGEEHWAILAPLIRDAQGVGPLVMDAHLAALTIEHGATLFTTDRDFARFEGLRFKNPLSSIR